MLAKSTIAGVTWGTTLSKIADCLAICARKRARELPVTVIPVCAEAEEFTGRPESSSSLASRISEILNGCCGVQWTLTRVPAFVPKHLFDTDKERGVREMMWSLEGLKKIFGRPKPGWQGAVGGLVDRVDMLLTSVGSAEHPMGVNYTELLKAGKITPRPRTARRRRHRRHPHSSTTK